jgi:hypothetical protein
MFALHILRDPGWRWQRLASLLYERLHQCRSHILAQADSGEILDLGYSDQMMMMLGTIFLLEGIILEQLLIQNSERWSNFVLHGVIGDDVNKRR